LNSAAAPSSLFVIGLYGQDNWFSAFDKTSDGFFFVNLSAAISSASVTQSLGI